MSDSSSSLEQCNAALTRLGVPAAAARHAFFVPGRIEVLGKHTDYAGGRSLLAAVERGFTIVAAARRDDTVRIMDVATGERATLTDVAPDITPSWVRYPDVVMRRLDRNFPDARGGADIAFISDLPIAAGLSSSSALVVAVFFALCAVRRVERTATYENAIGIHEDLAGYLGAVENGLDFGSLAGEAGVGTDGGSEDHTAILCSRSNRLVQYSFVPVRFERDVAMPDDHVFVVAASGVRAEKAGAALAAYNQMSGQTRMLVDLWQSAGGKETTLGAIIASETGAVAELRAIVAAHRGDGALLTRLAQFVAETGELIPGAVRCLERGDVRGFGAQVDRSQFLAEHALHNQVPETVALARIARALGAPAASAFGAGFGGSVWSMMRRADANAFTAAWREQYIREFPQHAFTCDFFTTCAAPAATRLG